MGMKLVMKEHFQDDGPFFKAMVTKRRVIAMKELKDGLCTSPQKSVTKGNPLIMFTLSLILLIASLC